MYVLAFVISSLSYLLLKEYLLEQLIQQLSQTLASLLHMYCQNVNILTDCTNYNFL